jgi:hypothetical protein
MTLIAAGALLSLAAFTARTVADMYVVQRWLGK